ncbi:MAG: class I SAM-dependent methyltransferase [Thaumarchaeota archaeon]|nr:class I SAM-dependent methyltransferase [Nitrososphaerota archaeon]
MRIPWLESGGIDKNFVDNLFKGFYKIYDRSLVMLTLGFDKSWKARLISVANLRSGNTVLDVAAGTGLLTLRIADRIGPNGRIIGLDINSEMMSKASRSSHRENVTFVKGLAEVLPLQDTSVDVVTSCYVLKYCDLAQFLKEVERILKADGTAVFYDFSRPSGSIGVLVGLYVFAILPILSRIIRPIHGGLGDVLEFLPQVIKSSKWEFAIESLASESGLELLSMKRMTGGIVTLIVCQKRQN